MFVNPHGAIATRLRQKILLKRNGRRLRRFLSFHDSPMGERCSRENVPRGQSNHKLKDTNLQQEEHRIRTDCLGCEPA